MGRGGLGTWDMESAHIKKKYRFYKRENLYFPLNTNTLNTVYAVQKVFFYLTLLSPCHPTYIHSCMVRGVRGVG